MIKRAMFAGSVTMIAGLAAFPAHAYVELGFFTVILQTAGAVLIGVLVALNLYWKKIVDGIRSFRDGDKPSKTPAGERED